MALLSLLFRNHVDAINGQLRHEKALLEEVADPNVKMVQGRCRIQKTWLEVCRLELAILHPFMRRACLHDLEEYLLVLQLIKVVYRADDLIPEENDTVLLALKRLPPQEAYDRVFRLRRAFQVQLSPLTPQDLR